MALIFDWCALGEDQTTKIVKTHLKKRKKRIGPLFSNSIKYCTCTQK